MPWIVVRTDVVLFPIGNLKTAASQVKKSRPLAAGALQILMQSIVHVPAITSDFDQMRVFHDLQMMRHSNHFGFEQFCDIADRELPKSQCVEDPQTMGITQRFQSLCTIISVENFLCHWFLPSWDKF